MDAGNRPATGCLLMLVAAGLAFFTLILYASWSLSEGLDEALDGIPPPPGAEALRISMTILLGGLALCCAIIGARWMLLPATPRAFADPQSADHDPPTPGA